MATNNHPMLQSVLLFQHHQTTTPFMPNVSRGAQGLAVPTKQPPPKPPEKQPEEPEEQENEKEDEKESEDDG